MSLMLEAPLPMPFRANRGVQQAGDCIAAAAGASVQIDQTYYHNRV